jgi:hypothetical protein
MKILTERLLPATTGENVNVAWWTNNTSNGNNEVMFRASTDGAVRFGDKINLSNTTDAISTRVEIDEEGDSVFVSRSESSLRFKSLVYKNTHTRRQKWSICRPIYAQLLDLFTNL